MKEVIGFMGSNVLVADKTHTQHHRVVVEDDGTMRALTYEEFNKRKRDEEANQLNARPA